MTTYFDLQQIADIGIDVANRTRGASSFLLAGGTAVAYAVAYARLLAPGRDGESNPLRVIIHALGLALLLVLYGKMTSSIADTSRQVAGMLTDGGSFEKFLSSFQEALKQKLSPPTEGKDWVSQAASLATSWSSGLLSGVLSVLSILSVILVFHLYATLQAVLFALLVAVGPLVIALSILPGASGMLGRWFMGLLEIALWPVLAAVVFEMLARAGMGHIYSESAGDFVALFCANIIFVVTVALIPAFTSRLVGNGFAAMSPMVLAATTSHFRSGASAGRVAGGAVAWAGKKLGGKSGGDKQNGYVPNDKKGDA